MTIYRRRGLDDSKIGNPNEQEGGMIALAELDGLIQGITSGRMNARWAASAKRYVLNHEEGIQLLLQHLEPHFPYLDVAVVLPLWDGCCQNHPEMLGEFLAIAQRSNPEWSFWVHLAGGCGQPQAFEAVRDHLIKTGQSDLADKLGPYVIHYALRQAIYNREGQQDSRALLNTLLDTPGATSWFAFMEQERPMPWTVAWARVIDPVDGQAIEALDIFDVLLERGVELNQPSPDNAQCWVMEELCHRYAGEPLGVGVLIEALVQRGAKTQGIQTGPKVQAFLDSLVDRAA